LDEIFSADDDTMTNCLYVFQRDTIQILQPANISAEFCGLSAEYLRKTMTDFGEIFRADIRGFE